MTGASKPPNTRVSTMNGTVTDSSRTLWGRSARRRPSVAVTRARRYWRANDRSEVSARAGAVSIEYIRA